MGKGKGGGKAYSGAMSWDGKWEGHPTAAHKSPYEVAPKFVSKPDGDAKLVPMLGRQPLSHRETAATHLIGTSTRDQTQSMFISKEHCKQIFGRGSPGPIYEVKSGLGTQTLSANLTYPEYRFGSVDRFTLGNAQVHIHNINPDHKPIFHYPGAGKYETDSSVGTQVYSSRRTAPKFSFGTGTRDQKQKECPWMKEQLDSLYGVNSPGPAVYDCKTSLGNQINSKKPSSDTPKFGTQGRLKGREFVMVGMHTDYEKQQTALPGAGTYEPAMSVGKQTLSSKRSVPVYGIGTGPASVERAKIDKQFIDKGHEKKDLSKEGPGPSYYNKRDSIGAQIDSKKRNSEEFGFGTEKRFEMNFNTGKDRPATFAAPGAYNT